MASEFEYDGLRKKLNTENLPDAERKKIIKSLADAGGKVLEERELEKNVIYTETKDNTSLPGQVDSSRSATKGSDKYALAQSSKSQNRLNTSKKTNNSKKDAASQGLSFLDSIILKLQSSFLGVSNFSVNYYKNAFLTSLQSDLSRVMLELSLLGEHLFLHSPNIGISLMTQIEEKDPILLNVFSRLFRLSDNKKIKQLNLVIDTHVEDYILINELYSHLKQMYNQLYPFLSRSLTIQYDLEWVIKEFYKLSPSIHSQKSVKNIFQSMPTGINLMFQSIPRKIIILASLVENCTLVPFTKKVEKVFAIDHSLSFSQSSMNSNDLLFYQSLIPNEEKKDKDFDTKNEENSDIENEENSTKKIESEPTSKEYQFGKTLFDKLNLDNLRDKFNPEGTWKNTAENISEISTILLYLLEFDNSYISHITNKNIKLTYSLKNNKKIDLAKNFSEQRSLIFKLKSEFNTYLDSISDLENLLNNDAQMAGKNKRKAKFQNDILQKKSKIEIQMNQISQSLYTDLSSIIKNLQTEENNIDKVIQNLDSTIKIYEKELTIEKAIIEFYCYITYLKHYVKINTKSH